MPETQFLYTIDNSRDILPRQTLSLTEPANMQQ